MPKKLVCAALLAAGLAGCGATPVETFNDKEKPLPPGEGLFGKGLTWQGGEKAPSAPAAGAPATAAPAAAAAGSAEQEEFKKWRESAGSAERSEFEEWRAWQEWKRKNPK